MHFQPVRCAVKFGGLPGNLCPAAGDNNSIMRFYPLVIFITACLLAPAASVGRADTVQPLPRPGREPVWQARLTTSKTDESWRTNQDDYNAAVEAMISAFERSTHRALVPGPKRRVGLKIYTDSGTGLATPVPLVKAVILALRKRGFENRNIFLVGLNQLRLRMTGYLPSLVTGKTPFEGNPVYVLESGRYYDPVWFYPSPLPERFNPVVAEQQTRGYSNTSTMDQDRKSFLATPLFLDADFWINLPVYTDHPVLGVNGALVNATLWNASNTARFFRSPANAPAAVAEMSAIPELRETWACTIASLEEYQYIGGPYFNSLYTASEPLLWLSDDPVIMDSLMRVRMNQWRRRYGFDDISDEIRTLEDAEMLGVGSTQVKNAAIVSVY